MPAVAHRRPPSARRSARLLAALPPALRGAALMPAAALLVHQLRYELAFGADAPRALAAQGHAYLSSLTPWIVLLAGLALGASLGSLVQRWADGRAASAAPRATGVRLWLLASAALVAIYAGQELLEGVFAGGHAAGFAAVLGGGGWWALPAALLVGGLLALALRVGVVAGEALAALAPPLRLSLRAALREARRLAPPVPALAVPAPLARAAAGRAPPGRAAAAQSA